MPDVQTKDWQNKKIFTKTNLGNHKYLTLSLYTFIKALIVFEANPLNSYILVLVETLFFNYISEKLGEKKQTKEKKKSNQKETQQFFLGCP